MKITVDLQQLAASAVVSILVGLVSSWVTVQLSLRKFRAEKWWERRATAYERVIESLHHCINLARALLDAEWKGKRMSEPEERRLRERMAEAIEEINKAINVGAFSLCDEARRRLVAYWRELDEIEEKENSWTGFLFDHIKCTQSCLDDLINIARKDLGLQPIWPRWRSSRCLSDNPKR